jgi:hypothetical protein
LESACVGLKIVIECKIIYTVTQGNKVGLRVFGRVPGKYYELRDNKLQGIVETELEV